MATTNSYTINGEILQPITGESADINMATATGVKAGCREYPVPLLNKITVSSADGTLSSSKTIYAGYKIVQQMLGTLTPANNYNPNIPRLNTIIHSGKFGIFEPAHYNSASRSWSRYDLSTSEISSLINLGTGIKICVKIDYMKSDSSAAIAYVPITGVISNRFSKTPNIEVPYYSAIGVQNPLPTPETIGYNYLDYYNRRSWFETTLTTDNLDINLSSYIVNPKTTVSIKVTLMAYIGDVPTADNTFPILPMVPSSTPSLYVPFETYEPEIAIFNADRVNNLDNYDDNYGSVAEYNSDSDIDTTISISIIAPD